MNSKLKFGNAAGKGKAILIAAGIATIAVTSAFLCGGCGDLDSLLNNNQQEQDSTAAPEDSTINPPDSTINPPDSTINPPDSTINPPDTTSGGGNPEHVIVDDWSVVSMEYDGEVEPIPDDYKMFLSFTSSGDLALTYFEKYGTFWLEDAQSGAGYSVNGNSLCLDWGYGDEGYCGQYSVSGNNLTLSFTGEDCYDDSVGNYGCESNSETIKAVRGNLASTRSSLGSSLKSQDPALNRTDWVRASSDPDWENDYIFFSGTYFFDYGEPYGSSFSYYDRAWYTESGNRLILVMLKCDVYELSADGYERCVSKSVDNTVTLDYQLANGTLRLRAPGKDWDTWYSSVDQIPPPPPDSTINPPDSIINCIINCPDIIDIIISPPSGESLVDSLVLGYNEVCTTTEDGMTVCVIFKQNEVKSLAKPRADKKLPANAKPRSFKRRFNR